MFRMGGGRNPGLGDKLEPKATMEIGQKSGTRHGLSNERKRRFRETSKDGKGDNTMGTNRVGELPRAV